jgi:hypothetical protein
MLEGIRQFFTFEEKLHTVNSQFPADFHTRFVRRDLQPYFEALEMLRGHLYRSLAQVAAVADIGIPKISDHMRYKDVWQLDDYNEHGLLEPSAQAPNPADPKGR